MFACFSWKKGYVDGNGELRCVLPLPSTVQKVVFGILNDKTLQRKFKVCQLRYRSTVVAKLLYLRKYSGQKIVLKENYAVAFKCKLNNTQVSRSIITDNPIKT